MKIIQANKPKYVNAIEGILERSLGSAELLRAPGMAWFLFQDKGRFVAVAQAYQISSVRLYVNIYFAPDQVHNRSRKQAGADLIEYLRKQVPDARKLELTIPEGDRVKMRYFSQIGFKREGVAKNSIVVDGELADQYYMGYSL